LEESLEEKTKCLENLEAAITGLSTTHFYSYIYYYIISGEIPKLLVKQINEGKTIPVQKYEWAAILVVYGIYHLF